MSTFTEPSPPHSESAVVSDYAAPSLARTDRLVSLDALRGFDMFWILGADALVHSIARAFDATTAPASATTTLIVIQR